MPEPESLGLPWWIAWCQQRTPEGFTKNLESWRKRETEELQQVRASAEAKARVRARILEAERGTGLGKCIKAGCEEGALAESVYCALHLLTINGTSEADIDCTRTQAALLRTFLEDMARSPGFRDR